MQQKNKNKNFYKKYKRGKISSLWVGSIDPP